MLTAQKRSILCGDEFYYLVDAGGEWYWQAWCNPADTWGMFLTKDQAITAAVNAGYTVC
jgi:hypothetical protein